MWGAAVFAVVVVLPAFSLAAIVSRWLEGLALAADRRDQSASLVVVANDLAARLDNLEQHLGSQAKRAGPRS